MATLFIYQTIYCNFIVFNGYNLNKTKQIIMSHEILALEPKVIWKHFYSLTQVPRPSKKEDRIREFCAQFGRDLGLGNHC